METKFSQSEMHHFKIAALAAMRDGDLPAGNYPEMDDGIATTSTPVAVGSTADKQSYTGKINYIRHLNLFFLHLKIDDRLKPHHAILYVTLFYVWNCNHFIDKFKVNRQLMMQLSKIGSRSTYINCLKWLHACGYIQYHPGNQKFEHSSVRVIPLDDATLSTLVKAKKNRTLHRPNKRPHTSKKNGPRDGIKNDTISGTDNEPYAGPILGHNINKQINIKTESKQIHAQKKIISHGKKIPTMEDVLHWFSQKGQTTHEARRFYFYYQAINWTISGQPIVNWEAVAEKWIENDKTYKNDKPGKLHTDKFKDYNHPL